MNIRVAIPLFVTLLLGCGSALAEAGSVTIDSPANDTTVSSGDDVALTFHAVPGPNGDHLHLNLDGRRIDIIRRMQGTAEVGQLPPGRHHICLAVNTKSHVPTGVEGCIDVTSR